MPRDFVAHYRIVKRLGAGGMGEVYLAQDTELERPVALKIMSAELARDPNQRKRFRTEAKAVSGLTHPHICVVYQVGETDDGRPFLAMEYVDGRALSTRMQGPRMKPGEILKIGIETAEALDAAHARGLVHRDIKPGNIMLTRQGSVKVLDFGLAKSYGDDELSSPLTTVAHTRTGMLIGTPQYMSPEQVLGRELGPGSDLFSLGLVLYELLVGQRPFLGRTVGETINNIVNQPAPPLGLDNPALSPALDQIILTCLEKDPARRYPTAKELVRNLQQARDNLERVLAETAHPAVNSPPREAQPLKTGSSFLGGSLAWLGRRFRSRKAPAPEPSSTAQMPHHNSVAVLPFVNMSTDPADEYLGDGISEDIIIALSKLRNLKVPARTSCFAFKGRNEDIKKIGRELRVGAVLEGSISRAGRKVRVTAQLINISDGFNMWSEVYDRALDDLLAIRTDVASRVAEALKGQLLGEDRQQLSLCCTESAEAYRLYLQGRYLWNRRTGDEIRKAITCFDNAIREDTGYALAYAGLADCYDVLAFYTSFPRSETLPKARAAALKALDLDNTLAAPHATLADIKAYLDWDWAGSETEFRRAIALNANHATAHHWYANLLDILGRHDEALEQTRLARELDPLSGVINALYGYQLFLNGRVNEAIESLRKQITLDPAFVVTRNQLGWVYLHQGRTAEAIVEFEAMHKLDDTYGLGDLGVAYARAGRTGEAQKILERMLDLQRQGLDCRVSIASVYHALGKDDAALETLEQALAEHASGLEALSAEPLWKALRPHPRVQAILHKMNLAGRVR